MQQIFIDNNSIMDGVITVDGDDARHLINVVRIKSGEQIRVSTSNEDSYLCEVDTTDNGVLTLKIIEEVMTTELPCRIRLYQAIPKGDRMETVIEKCTELGVSQIIPVEMERCVVRLDDKKKEKKLKRYQNIAEAAAQQSKRSHIPSVSPVMTFEEAVADSDADDIMRIVPYENKNGMTDTAAALDDISKFKDIAIFIGPEGGFAPHEIEALKDSYVISLGRRILRTDTAAIATVAMIMLQIEQTC